MVLTDGEREVAFVRAVSGLFFVEKFGLEAHFLDLTGPAADVRHPRPRGA
jgi:hypothetical protein